MDSISSAQLQEKARVESLERIERIIQKQIKDRGEKLDSFSLRVGRKNIISQGKDADLTQFNYDEQLSQVLEAALSGASKPGQRVVLLVNGEDSLSISKNGRVNYDDLGIVDAYRSQLQEQVAETSLTQDQASLPSGLDYERVATSPEPKAFDPWVDDSETPFTPLKERQPSPESIIEETLKVDPGLSLQRLRNIRDYLERLRNQEIAKRITVFRSSEPSNHLETPTKTTSDAQVSPEAIRDERLDALALQMAAMLKEQRTAAAQATLITDRLMRMETAILDLQKRVERVEQQNTIQSEKLRQWMSSINKDVKQETPNVANAVRRTLAETLARTKDKALEYGQRFLDYTKQSATQVASSVSDRVQQMARSLMTARAQQEYDRQIRQAQRLETLAETRFQQAEILSQQAVNTYIEGHEVVWRAQEIRDRAEKRAIERYEQGGDFFADADVEVARQRAEREASKQARSPGPMSTPELEYEATYRKHVSVDTFEPGRGECLYVINSDTEQYLGNRERETSSLFQAKTFGSLDDAVQAIPNTGKYVVVASSAQIIEPENIPESSQQHMAKAASQLLKTFGSTENGVVKVEVNNLAIAASDGDNFGDIAISDNQTGMLLAEFTGDTLVSSALAPDDIYTFEELNRQLETSGKIEVEVREINHQPQVIVSNEITGETEERDLDRITDIEP